ncbi:MAG: hypothetical protein ABI480_14135 [Chitinophagaceae bacterium]
MGLNDIKLPASLTTSFYRTTLVETGEYEPIEKPIVIEQPAPGEWKYLGDNKKNILIAVNYPGISHLPDEELIFLTNILAACKLDLGDIAIVNIANTTQASYKDYYSFFKSKIIILFGIYPLSFGLPVDFPPFQVQSVAGSTFLHSPSLGECRQDTLIKSKLWVCLRRIFGI